MSVKKTIKWIVAVIAVIVTFVIISSAVFHRDGDRMLRKFGVGCESNPNPVFSVYPTDINKVLQLKPPLMKVSSGMKGHSYIDVSERVPVYAPADARLVEGTKYREDLGGRGDIDQYILTFVVSCEVYYFFDHLIDPPQHIKDAFPGPAKATTHTQVVDAIDIRAGDFLGYSAGTGWHNFDFGVINTSKRTILADDTRYNSSDKYVHADCPYAYYAESMHKRLFDLMGYDNASDLEVIDNLCAYYK